MLRAQEAFLNRVIEEGDERGVEAVDVQQPERFGVQAELRPRCDLDDLLDRAETARECDEAVRQLGHQRLAFVHRPTTRSSVIVMPTSRPSTPRG